MASSATATVMKMLESLPVAAQEHVVEHLQDYLEDMRDDMQWSASFARSQDALAAAARKARAEASCGMASPLNPDEL